MDEKSLDSAFETLGLKAKEERTALLVSIVSRISPFAESIEGQNKVLLTLLRDLRLDRTVRNPALATLAPPIEVRSK